MIRSVRAGGLAAAAFLAALFAGQPALAETAPVPAVVEQAAGAAEASPAVVQPAVAAPASAVATLRPAVALVVPGQASLAQLAERLAATEIESADQECLANAVFFEARGEPLAGQLAVAEVVLNRAASGRYPPDICSVVKQRAQFSFVRRGQFPRADRGSDAWRRAVAISRVALFKLASEVSHNVLWYHADYVAPSWGQNLRRETKIGLHIFYR